MDGHNETCLPIQVSQLSDEVKTLQLQTITTKGKTQKLDSLLCKAKKGKETNTSPFARISAIESQMRNLEYHHVIKQQKTTEACYQSVDNIHKQYKTRIESLNHHIRFLTEKYLKLEDTISMQTARLQQLENEVSQHRKGISTDRAFTITAEVRFAPGQLDT